MLQHLKEDDDGKNSFCNVIVTLIGHGMCLQWLVSLVFLEVLSRAKY